MPMEKVMEIQKSESKLTEFHGYVGHLAVLKDGRTVRILGGHKFKLFVKDLDGKIEECYHDDLDYIMEA
jgi:hypothetical protein